MTDQGDLLDKGFSGGIGCYGDFWVDGENMDMVREEVGKKELVEKIVEEIKQEGRITFARFMEMCLYEPGLGYYTSPGERIGWTGDYYTSPDLHPIFGRLIGKQLSQMRSLLGEREFTVVEMGAGKGLLAREILTYCEESSPDIFDGFRYVVCEKSPFMVARQKEILSGLPWRNQIIWTDTLRGAVPPGGGVGCFLSNELVDSFPVHRVMMRGGGLHEMYVTFQNDRFVDVVGGLSTPDLLSYFQRLGISVEEEAVADVNLEALRWIREIGRSLARGFVLTIDYGHPAYLLYSSSRRRGSLLCYFKHSVSHDPYIRVGEQDMTAHIDFTSLAMVGKEVGLEVTGFADQTGFLLGLGIVEEMERVSDLSEARAMRALIDPRDIGWTFKVLIQHKGIATPLLDGLRFRPSFPLF